jgi:hypothetical protein
MLQLQLDTKAAQETVDAMVQQIDHFKRVDVGQVLSEWQTEDMHRHRPFTMRSRAKGKATTIIRPHSRFEMQRSAYAQTQHARVERILAKPHAPRYRYKGKLRPYRLYRRWSTRPILRSEMMETLTRRASEAFAKIRWNPRHT